MNKSVRSCIYAVIGGACLYIVGSMYSLIPYINGITSSLAGFEMLFVVGNILSAVIITYVLMYKKSSILQMLLRLVVLFLTVFVLFLLNGYIGTFSVLYKVLSISTTSSRDNVSGMLTLTFYAVAATVSIVILIVTSAIRTCRFIANQINKDNYQT